MVIKQCKLDLAGLLYVHAWVGFQTTCICKTKVVAHITQRATVWGLCVVVY